MLKKVKRLVDKENPASYRDIAKQTSLSPPTINKIIVHDLGMQSKKKAKVHKLMSTHKKNRKTNCRKLYERHLAGDRSEYAVTLDEALIYLDDTNKKRRICYVKRAEPVPESWIFENDESFKKGFMVIGVITGKGTLPLIRVPSAVKVNAQYYVDYVLRPLFTQHLPALYGKEINKVFFHHDKATSHTANLTTAYLEKLKVELGINYLAKEDIPVKSPDASPLDFFGFGYLKQKLTMRRATTLEGVWKLSQEVWSDISVDTCQQVFAAWKRRLRLVSAKNGEQIEHMKAIHRRRI
jgi:[histone H3]-lysine36 N-dimethyltransferase SETMAR